MKLYNVSRATNRLQTTNTESVAGHKNKRQDVVPPTYTRGLRYAASRGDHDSAPHNRFM
jgi:hypothetical protein